MLHIFREFRELWARVRNLETVTKGLLREMADLNKAEQDVEASEDAMEKRIQAHESNLKAVAADLQKQIDALKSGADNSAAIAALQALKGKLDNFDADVAPAVVNPPAGGNTPPPDGTAPSAPPVA